MNGSGPTSSVFTGDGVRHGSRRRRRSCRLDEGRKVGREMKLGFRVKPAARVFIPAKITLDRRIWMDGPDWPAIARAKYGPGGILLSRPRPRLRPGTRGRARGSYAGWFSRLGPKKKHAAGPLLCARAGFRRAGRAWGRAKNLAQLHSLH